MSLLPFFLDDYARHRPSRIHGQHFGMGLEPEDLLAPLTIEYFNPNRYLRPLSNVLNALQTVDTGATVVADKDKFQVNLDVQQFAPEEITVKTTGENTIEVEGKHEEKRDEHGFISRHFVRKYTLPKGHDIQQVVTHLSSDGVLSITAPKVEQGEQKRTIPIQQTGKPTKAVANKEDKMETQ